MIKEDHKESAKETLDPVGASIKDAAFSCFHSYNPKSEQNLDANEQIALKALLKEDTIIIQKSDNGNSVVILNRADYVKRMEELLSDTTKFKHIEIQQGQDYNYLINQELRISKALRILRNNGAITEHTYLKLNPTGTQPSVL